MATRKQSRPLYEVAIEIQKEWKNVHFGAVPYLKAMRMLESVNDYYGFDKGELIVRYFLSNSSSWKGEAARRIKKELREMVGMQ